MKRLVIHIGSSKTGTSSLQHLFVDNYDALLEQKVLYPKSCRQSPKAPNSKLRVNRHYALKNAIRALIRPGERDSSGFFLKPSFIPEHHAQTVLDELDAEIETATNAETVFISDEGLTERMTPEEVKFLSDWARSRFREIKIVLCLREPFSYLTSKFSQSMKADRGQEWSEFSEKFLSEGFYEWKIKQWKDNFDAEDFIILPRPNDSIDFFCSILNVDRSRLKDAGQRRNISLDPLAATVMHEVNKLCATLDPKTIGRKNRKKVRRHCLEKCLEMSEENFRSGPSLFSFADVSNVYSNLENDIQYLKSILAPSEEYSLELEQEWTPEFVAKKLKLDSKPLLDRDAYAVEAKTIAGELVQSALRSVKKRSSTKLVFPARNGLQSMFQKIYNMISPRG